MTTAYLNRIATAVPVNDVHDAFAVFAEKMLGDLRLRTVFCRMVRLLAVAEVLKEAVTVEHWRPGRLCVGRRK
jgi:hypothetical protein